ncbi:yeats family protein [Lentinula edodes]|uniref:yeats family-domain-containing protein n=1 Tax=Lentinula edodes TaxID=5353 RepID=UPI001E8CC2E1|nr:yeats family-domain-containing protein [Lentinula edodes]KAH7876470.1 yeats family-domain-containing protein [Lentinula edodes]KAJ3897802.1 yeats family protein [Lentinula edodes]
MANADRVRVRGLSIARPIVYGNSARLLTSEERENVPPEHTHRWTVALRSAASAPGSDIVGGADDLSYFIKRVSFKLHETYPNPMRNIDKPPFELSETGWGEFEVHIKLHFIPESGEKVITIYHHLKLHPWSLSGDTESIPPLEVAQKAGTVHSWQYEEIVFNDPYQNFLNILTNNPPTPIPRTNTSGRTIPFHIGNPASFESLKGGVPEFTSLLEKDEAERLDKAKKLIIAEQEKTRALLIAKEKELARLQKMLNG